MKLVTARQMQAIDRAAADECGLPTLILMENAGRAVAVAVRRHAPQARTVAILAGAGNNGGDGFVAARHLSLNSLPGAVNSLPGVVNSLPGAVNSLPGAVNSLPGAGHLAVTVFLAAPREKLKGAAALNFHALRAFPVSIREVTENNLSGELAALGRSDLLVDALFGTGLCGPLSPFYIGLIEGAQAAAIPILAVDIPSGLGADSGTPLGASFRATWTVTMGLPKVGMWAPSAAAFVGEMEVAEIGFPPDLLADESLSGHLIGPDLLGGILPPRPNQAHKGSSGTVLVLAGSLPYRGAANLAGMAALRSGAGLSRLGLPRSLCLLNLDKPDELVQWPLPEEDSPALTPAALEMALEAAAEANAVVLGPGLGQDPRTAAFVFAFLRRNRTATVLDADGLNIVASNPAILLETPAPLVLTPHPGEMGRLLTVSTQVIQEDRIGCCLEASGRYGCVAVLKGFHTVVGDPTGRFYINPTGGPAMATAGIGDILAGAIGGLLAQGATPLEAALLGVYAHGLAGDLAAAEIGKRGILPSDLLPRLPRALEMG